MKDQLIFSKPTSNFVHSTAASIFWAPKTYTRRLVRHRVNGLLLITPEGPRIKELIPEFSEDSGITRAHSSCFSCIRASTTT